MGIRSADESWASARVDLAKVQTATEEDIEGYMIAEGENPDAPLEGYRIVAGPGARPASRARRGRQEATALSNVPKLVTHKLRDKRCDDTGIYAGLRGASHASLLSQGRVVTGSTDEEPAEGRGLIVSYRSLAAVLAVTVDDLVVQGGP